MRNIDGVTAQLRQSEPYFDDHGFTAAVLAALPEERQLPLWVKNLIMIGATAAGSAVVAWQMSGLHLEPLLGQVSFGYTTIGAAALFVYAFSSATVWVARREVI